MSEGKTLTLLLHEPSPYFCAHDEDHFFGWLQSVPAVEGVRGTPAGLEVKIAVPIDDDDLRSLIGLHARYGLDASPLRALRTARNEKWFHDPRKYWFASVFGAGAASDE
jgi:hypothetical protein